MPKLLQKPQKEIPGNIDVIDRGVPAFSFSDTGQIDGKNEETDDSNRIALEDNTTNEQDFDFLEDKSEDPAIASYSGGLEESKPSLSLVQSDAGSIPDYSGEGTILLNGNIPEFNEHDFSHITGDYYSELDSLGRCGVAYAMLDKSLMPTEKRGSIGQVKPSGWNQEKYPGIVDSEPPYLYNRCHLIAYSLTGQNANERNLITGTRYFNINGMLSYESAVADCVEYSGYHVLYRVTPYFKDNELLARGVELEAYSIEDQGNEICIHVFIYNVQPGVEINYTDGTSRAEE